MNESYTSARSSTSKGKLPALKGPKPKPAPISGKRKRGPFDLEPDAEEETFMGETSLVNGTGPTDNTFDEGLQYGGLDESLHLDNGGDPSPVEDSQMVQEQDIISPSIEKDTATMPAKMKGRRGKPATAKPTQVETTSTVPDSGRRGRPPKKSKTSKPVEEPVEAPVDPSMEEPIEVSIEEGTELPAETAEEVVEPRKKPGRVPKAAMEPPKSKPGRAKGALSLKDPNMKLKPTRTRRASSAAARGSMSPSKTRFITRSETPGDELHFMTTRAGRNVVKPLAYWRGESAVFGEGRLEEGQLILPSIKEVIRTEEVPEPRRRRAPGQPRRRRPKRPTHLDDIPEDEEDEAAYWETEAGVMQASVMLWDPEIGRGDENNTEQAGEFHSSNIS